MYVDIVPNRKSPPAVLLREGWREGKRVRKRTIANLSSWPDQKVRALRKLLRNEPLVSADELFTIVRSRPHVLDFGIFGREIVGLFEPGRLSSFSHSDEPSTAKPFLARDQTMQIRPSTTPSHPQVRMGWQDFPD